MGTEVAGRTTTAWEWKCKSLDHVPLREDSTLINGLVVKLTS